MVLEGGPGVFAPGETSTSTLSASPARWCARRGATGSAWRAWPAAEPGGGAAFTRLGPTRPPGGRAGDWRPGQRSVAVPAADRTAAPGAADDVALAPPPRGDRRSCARSCGGRRARRPRGPPPKVTILLVHAWGMGGTIRTMLNVAGRLAERHEVEVVSVWRTRERAVLRVPPGVTVTAAEDRRPGAGGPRGRELLRRVPGALLYPGDRTSRRTTLWTDVQLVRAARGGCARACSIGTRPALNLLVLPGRRRGPARVATEHAPFDALQRVAASARSGVATRALDAVVVLGERRARGVRGVSRPTPVHVIPNAVPALPGGARRALDGAGRPRRSAGWCRSRASTG